MTGFLVMSHFLEPNFHSSPKSRNILFVEEQITIVTTVQKLVTELTPLDIVLTPLFLFMHYSSKKSFQMVIMPLWIYSYPYRHGLELIFACFLGGFVSACMKFFIGAPRPFWLTHNVRILFDVKEVSFSTPSNHATVGAATATIYYLQNLQHSFLFSTVLLIGSLIYVSLVSLSRLYFAVHWPQDVILGACIGLTAGLAVHFGSVMSLLNTLAERSPWSLMFLYAGYLCIVVVFMLFLQSFRHGSRDVGTDWEQIATINIEEADMITSKATSMKIYATLLEAIEIGIDTPSSKCASSPQGYEKIYGTFSSYAECSSECSAESQSTSSPSGDDGVQSTQKPPPAITPVLHPYSLDPFIQNAAFFSGIFLGLLFKKVVSPSDPLIPFQYPASPFLAVAVLVNVALVAIMKGVEWRMNTFGASDHHRHLYRVYFKSAIYFLSSFWTIFIYKWMLM
jgi:undecaprenyl-diphosphatase